MANNMNTFTHTQPRLNEKHAYGDISANILGYTLFQQSTLDITFQLHVN